MPDNVRQESGFLPGKLGQGGQGEVEFPGEPSLGKCRREKVMDE